MNTDKIYAEQLANEYAPKDTSKVNYPIYKKLLAQGKQKYAFEIMELAKEISEM